jgi:glyoxylase-like metal-dependent hydrolase (beta-lactamase superfamily II)
MAPRQPDRPAEDGATVAFGGASCELLHTPGHTPGSVCVLLGDRHLFTGDTLFPGGPGNTFGDAEAFATIIRSLQERLFTLDDDTWVYPGHGDDTTLGAERPRSGVAGPRLVAPPKAISRSRTVPSPLRAALRRRPARPGR